MTGKIVAYFIILTGIDIGFIFLHASAFTRTMIKAYCKPLADDFGFLVSVMGNGCLEHLMLTILATCVVMVPIGLYFTVLRFGVLRNGFQPDRPLVAAGLAGGIIILMMVIGMELNSFFQMWSQFGHGTSAWAGLPSASSTKGPVFTVAATLLTTAIAQAAAFVTALIYHTQIFKED